MISDSEFNIIVLDRLVRHLEHFKTRPITFVGRTLSQGTTFFSGLRLAYQCAGIPLNEEVQYEVARRMGLELTSTGVIKDIDAQYESDKDKLTALVSYELEYLLAIRATLVAASEASGLDG